MSQSLTSTETFQIAALHCADEFSLIEKGLGGLDGVRQLAPNYLDRSLRVEFDPGRLDAAAIGEHLRRIGFPAQTTAECPCPATSRLRLPRLRVTTIVGGVLLLAAAVWRLVLAEPIGLAGLAIASALLSGWPVVWAAWRAIRLMRLDMNALMVIAAAGAIAIAPATGEWLEAPTAMFLFSISLWLESYSIGRARRAVQSLVALTPESAHRLGCDADNGTNAVDVPVAELVVGDRVIVKPGERVPIDGVVEAGSSSVNEAPITGESMPVEKTVESKVFAGSLNGESVLRVRATKIANDSTLAQVARLVERAQSNQSPTERFVDRFARYYTPAVVALAIAIALGPPILAGLNVGLFEEAPLVDWLHRGLVLLVIACPCALVISTPVTIVCGLHRATRHGMLVKGGEFLEAAGRIDCLAIDKTGTLTLGEPQVIEVRPAAGFSAADVLRVAAALESGSEHPLAAAIIGAARERNVSWPAAAEVTAIRGFGVRGQIDDTIYFVASPRFFHEQRLGGTDARQVAGGDSAATFALVGTREKLLGAILLADQPRADAPAAIASLKQLGISKLVMLTGDNAAVATRIAHRLGIEDVYAELLPEDKVARVEQLAAEHRCLAMVGDGVNDAPALAAARLGIALGAQASDTALETADVVVLSPQLTRLPELVRLGRKTRRILGENISLALTLKLAVLVLAAVGLATMWMAVAADVGASMIVIFNGMRLLKRLP